MPADMCTAYSDFAGMYCTASKCLLARPGADCKPGSGRFILCFTVCVDA